MNESRWIQFDGLENCRDLGGLQTPAGTTKFNRCYRSDAFDTVSPSDINKLTELGIRSVIDFRAEAERTNAPNRFPSSVAIQQQPLGFLPGATLRMFEQAISGQIDAEQVKQRMLRHYRLLTFNYTHFYRAALEYLLRRNSTPAVFHCTSGKDRTGIFAAILLSSVGVSKDDIIADYELTNGRITPIPALQNTPYPDTVAQIMKADPDYLRHAFDTMEAEYGSVENYISQRVGVSIEQRAQLRAMFL